MAHIPVETVLIAGIALVLVSVIAASAWISARMRGTARELQRALITAARQSKPVAPPVSGPRQAGPFWEKQQEVYAALYARYRRAADGAVSRPGRTPEFGTFSRDELLRYLSRRKVRERDATDAIAALDRGDTFAMTRLMIRLHEKVDQRDASTALQRATRFEAMNELYLSEAVREAVAGLRQRLTPAEPVGPPTGERRQGTLLRATDSEIRDALGTLQRVMREELGGEPAASPVAPKARRLAPPGEQAVSPSVHIDGVRAV